MWPSSAPFIQRYPQITTGSPRRSTLRHTQYDLASAVPGIPPSVSFPHLFEQQHLIDDGARLAALEERAHYDYRRTPPRFLGETFQKNFDLVREIESIARQEGCTRALWT